MQRARQAAYHAPVVLAGTPEGYLMVGSPQPVIDKILYEHELFGNTRFPLQISISTIPPEKMLRSIELFGDVVAPAVRKALKNKETTAGKA